MTTDAKRNPPNWFDRLREWFAKPALPKKGHARSTPVPGNPGEDLETFQQEIRDARELQDFSIANGRSVDDDIIAGIQNAEDLLTATAMLQPRAWWSHSSQPGEFPLQWMSPSHQARRRLPSSSQLKSPQPHKPSPSLPAPTEPPQPRHLPFMCHLPRRVSHRPPR